MAAGKLTFTGINMSAGQVLRIDTQQRTATLNGTSVLNNISSSSTWFTLGNGDNELVLTGDDATDTATVKIQWRDRYL